MRFVQGTIKRLAKGEGGTTRLLLERKDGTEFVAVVSKNIHIGGVGTLFKAGGFKQTDSVKGRDCYEQVEEGLDNTSFVDLSEKDTVNNQGISKSVNKSTLTEVEKCSIELSALINLTSQLLQQPIEEVINDINKVYKSL